MFVAEVIDAGGSAAGWLTRTADGAPALAYTEWSASRFATSAQAFSAGLVLLALLQRWSVATDLWAVRAGRAHLMVSPPRWTGRIR